MNGELWQITAEQMKGMVDAPYEVEYAAGLSSHIIVGRYSGEVICLLGFIPKALISDTGYLWLHLLPSADRYKFLLARYGKQVLDRAHQVYPIIIGHCFFPSSRRWLERLGAKFTSPTTFEFRRG